MKKSVAVPVALALAACAGGVAEESEIVIDMPETALTEISADEWAALASRRIFFGHQSVGRDILDGVELVLEQHPSIALHVRQASGNPASIEGPGVFEAAVGQNRHPKSKSAAFLDALSGGFGDEPGAIATYKFCYIDVNDETDPETMFADYSATIDEVRRRHPALRIIHFTLPLKAAPSGLKERIRSALGRSSETRRNHIRNRYNELLRAAYNRSDPIFDLALLESTRRDGSRAHSRYQGRDVYMLAPEYTYDGGHLNEEGKRYIAERFLVFLARLDAGQGSSAQPATVNMDLRGDN